jgi:hypothetical protein
MDHRQGAADDSLSGQGRRLAATPCYAAALLDGGDKHGEYGRAARGDEWSRLERLDDAHAGNVGLGVEPLQEDGERAADALTPVALCFIGSDDGLSESLDGRVEGGQEALVAIVEELVEGATRDAGALADTTYARVLEALLSEDFHERQEHPPSLHLCDVAALARNLRGGGLLIRAHAPP